MHTAQLSFIGIIKLWTMGKIVERKEAYCQPPTPQSNIANSFVRQRGSNFDVLHDTWLIGITSHET